MCSTSGGTEITQNIYEQSTGSQSACAEQVEAPKSRKTLANKAQAVKKVTIGRF